MSFLLDTSVCVAFLRGRDERVRRALVGRDPSDLLLCSVVRAELLHGARRSARVEANLGRMQAFCAPMRSLPFDDKAAARCAVVRTQLEREGAVIGASDLMIASIALAADATLVTRNADEFRRVANLRIEEW